MDFLSFDNNNHDNYHHNLLEDNMINKDRYEEVYKNYYIDFQNYYYHSYDNNNDQKVIYI